MLEWQSASRTRQIIPNSRLFTAERSNGTGLQATYYSAKNLTNPILTRTDAEVDFNWGTNAPATGVGTETFSVRWTGQVEALYSETYRFYTSSDDGVRLWINGELLIDDWTSSGYRTRTSSPIFLNAGQRYDIVLEYYEDYDSAQVHLSWSSPSQYKQVIPKSQLFPS